MKRPCPMRKSRRCAQETPASRSLFLHVRVGFMDERDLLWGHSPGDQLLPDVLIDGEWLFRLQRNGFLQHMERRVIQLITAPFQRTFTRFARFFNLPELMNLFKEVADIKTADQLHLPTPEACGEHDAPPVGDLVQIPALGKHIAGLLGIAGGKPCVLRPHRHRGL